MLFTVHRMKKSNNRFQIKGTCHRKSHKKSGGCVCWVSKMVTVEESQPLLQDVIKWGSDGDLCSEAEHFTRSTEIKRDWGMKV